LIPSRQEIFLFPIKQTSSEVTQPPIHWVPWAVSLRPKRQGHKTDHSLPNSAEVKNSGATLPFPHIYSWHGACFIKPRDNFTFTLLKRIQKQLLDTTA
jgi:hypothetical protein